MFIVAFLIEMENRFMVARDEGRNRSRRELGVAIKV